MIALDTISEGDKLIMRFHDLEYLAHPRNSKVRVLKNQREAISLRQDMAKEPGRYQAQKSMLDNQLEMEKDSVLVMGLLSGDQRLKPLILEEGIDERLKAAYIYNMLPKDRREGLVNGYQKPRKEPYKQIPMDRRQS